MPARSVRKQRSCKKEGCGVFNNFLTNLKYKLHWPGYHFLGPGTDLKKRLARGDKPVNQLDRTALFHDLSYSRHKDSPTCHIADRILKGQA